MEDFISSGDWILAPPEDLKEALVAVNKWLEILEDNGMRRQIDGITTFNEVTYNTSPHLLCYGITCNRNKGLNSALTHP